MSCFSALVSLSLRHNRLTELPEVFSKLPLQRCDLMGNPLRCLPPQLNALNINKDQFKQFSAHIYTMTELRYLFIDGCEQDLSEKIGELRNLIVLSISRPRFTVLPEAIGLLTNLERLELGGFRAKSLPESMRNLKKLQFAWIYPSSHLGEQLCEWHPKIKIR